MADGKLDEIKSFLKDVRDCRVSMEDLKNPNTDVTIRVFCAFLNILGHSTDHLNQMPFHILPESEHFQDIIPLINLTQVINLILARLGVNIKFYLDDLLNPKPKKIKFVFTHLYQYCLFFQDRVQVYKPFAEEYELQLSQEEEMCNEIEKMKSDINQYQAEIQVLNQSHLTEQLQETDSVLSEATKRKEKYVSEREHLKTELNAAIQNHKALSREQQNLPDTIKEMEMKVLPSMDKVQDELNLLESNIEEWNGKCKELRDKAAEFDIKLKLGNSVNQIGLINLDNEILSQATVIQEMLKKRSENKNLIEMKKSETLVSEKRIDQQNGTLKALKQQNEKQLRRLQRGIATKESELESVQVIHSKGVSVVNSIALEKKKDKLIQSIKEEDKKEESSQKEFQSMCQQLDNLVVQDAEEWAAIVGKTTQDLLDIDEVLMIKCGLKQ